MLRWMLVLGITVALGMATMAPASAQQNTTAVWQVNVTVPILDRAVLGTLTTVTDSETGEGSWSFHGTVDGHLAQSSGAGSVSGSGSTATLALTSIETWDMPGLPRPATLPDVATVRSVGNVAYVSYNGGDIQFSGVPVALSPQVSLPLESGTYTVTMAGSGSQAPQVLPQTGQSMLNVSHLQENKLAISVMMIGIAMATAIAGYAFNRRRLEGR